MNLACELQHSYMHSVEDACMHQTDSSKHLAVASLIHVCLCSASCIKQAVRFVYQADLIPSVISHYSW